ncbi:AsmA family protein [uncultured Tolumonas sp.]|uniref:AsmA family protein n=1 Tax=uncultured Tolumonas sp. TaxID=263765 RepID=UPI00292CCD42|nr:AsmA family protein [uncultured Tolumonas sp.]
MNKITKYSLYSAGSVVVLLAGSVFYITATFDANSLKPRLEAWVKAEKQRTLKFNGPISLSLFPKPGLALSDVNLSERNADALFAHVSNARVTMQFWPLLSKKFIINEVDIQGATINLIKDKTGQFNFADLADTNKPAGNKALPDVTGANQATNTTSSGSDFHLAQFNIANSSFKYLDQQSGQQVMLSDLSLFGDTITAQSAGHIDFSSRLQSTAPVLDLQVNTKLDRVNFDKKTGQLLLDGLYNVLDGKLGKETFKLTLTAPKLNVTDKNTSADTISFSASLNGATRKIDSNFKLEGLSGDNQQVNAKTVKFDLNATQDTQAVKLAVSGPLAFKLAAQALSLPQLIIKGDVTNGDMKALPVDLTGKLAAEVKAQHINTALAGSLDQNPLALNADVKGFSNPAIRFDLKAQSLDLNRYMTASKSANSTAKENTEQSAGNKTPPAKIDLSGLNALNMDGQVNLGQLKYAALDAKDLSLLFNIKNGLLSIPALSLKAFGGDIAASGSATTTSSPRISVKPNIAGVDIYALLKQFAGFEKIEGRATVAGSLAMQGGDTSALKNSLTGNLNTRVTDGAWRGINVAKTIRDAKAALSGLKGGEQAVATSNVEKTDFTELTASILFNQGVATNKDLIMKSPLLRVSGEGDVNLKADDINYLLKAALVNTSKGQEGADRDKLHGVTIPIRIKGPTSAPKYSLDLTAALKENAGAKLEEKKQKVQQKLEQKAGDALSKGLKKLF